MGKLTEIVAAEFIESGIASIVAMLDDGMKEELKENASKIDKFTDKIPEMYGVSLMKGKDGKMYAFLAKAKDIHIDGDYERFCLTDMIKTAIEGL